VSGESSAHPLGRLFRGPPEKVRKTGKGGNPSWTSSIPTSPSVDVPEPQSGNAFTTGERHQLGSDGPASEARSGAGRTRAQRFVAPLQEACQRPGLRKPVLEQVHNGKRGASFQGALRAPGQNCCRWSTARRVGGFAIRSSYLRRSEVPRPKRWGYTLSNRTRPDPNELARNSFQTPRFWAPMMSIFHRVAGTAEEILGSAMGVVGGIQTRDSGKMAITQQARRRLSDQWSGP